ncbi:YjiH family protein [Pseudomonas chengduensis]|jgi:nucleoside recognition membrane protein YjiH|uniref:Nucleoside recognition GATE domain-containing membrane protein YjiH n=1 Tax=Pseudomonas sihuiensis TaxID=1274359 RepID=A0A1H2L8Q5_9PSED|nr:MULTISPECIES: YjiH family protein [Pseudomonas]MBG0846949.1 YjiH family protein [Pseudomonas chengduensis]MDH0957129.1 YjiH family protein [Pseudomonas chengduensis]MDH1620151.1 YjiH family protein [Pseudomonas chengduensis]MDH1865811.1 YjiH family protein [Pseudomonas chengduensis]WFS20720.1 YjiH family protein [Pseudomonas sp. 905_Psudmo1]
MNRDETIPLLDDQPPTDNPYSVRQLLIFLIPSLLGVLLFLTPIVYEEKVTIGLGVMADALKAAVSDQLPAIATGLLIVSAVLGLFGSLLKPRWLTERRALNDLFVLPPLWLALRVLGGLFAAMTFWQFGPEWVWNANTGGVVLKDLAPVLITFFLVAGLILPLLTDYGLMEFCGTLVRNVFRKIFGLPGRSAIDAIASWLGSGTVGVLITAQQYQKGFYSAREAAVIATNFSIASIAFSLLITSFMKLDHLFVPFYLTVVVAGLAAAIITPRIPPLSWKKDEYVVGVGKQINEDVPAGTSLLRWGLLQAVRRANANPSPGQMVKVGVHNVVDIWLGLLPLVMAIGTVSLAIAEFTPIFNWLSAPIVPLLELLQLPEATKAAPAMLVGFADMFLPAVLGKGIESELTRFVVACVSLTQLIYMSEVGVLIIKAKLPLNLLELFVIFIIRTLITLPIIALMAHWIVG